MTPERWQQIGEIYAEVLDLPPSERAGRIRSLADGDDSLCCEVEQLLSQTDDADSFLERPILAGLKDDASFGTWLNEGMHIGGYRINSHLGEGGMGVVYVAEQEHPRRTVALKIIKPALAKPAALRRFEHEAQILGKLHHPGIAQIFEAGTTEVALPTVERDFASPGRTPTAMRLPFFAMELVDGAPLNHYVRDCSLSTRQTIELAARICDAVQHAHQRGVIHRDLKPANIMIVDNDRTGAYRLSNGDHNDLQTSVHSASSGRFSQALNGWPKILDFGVARLTDADVTLTTDGSDVGPFLGTLPYMSPEQVSGDSSALDTRSDIYTLGVTFYETLSGALPLCVKGRGIPEAARIIRDEDPQPLSSNNKQLRGDIEVIIAKAMEKDPDRRYASAAEFAADLRRYLSDEPITAKPSTTLHRIVKFVRRNRAVTSGAVIALSGLLGGSGFAISQAIQASRDRDAAVIARDEATTQSEITRAVNEFLSEDLLSAADPTLGDRDTTVLEVLDRSSASVDGRFGDRPLVEAAIRFTLGRTYLGLGRGNDAQKHLERSYALRLESLGRNHAKTIASRVALLTLMMHMGHFDEAETEANECLAMCEAAELLDSDDCHIAKHNLASVFAQKMRLDDAERLYSEVIESSDSLRGTDSLTSLTSRYMLATVYRHQADFAKSSSLYEQVLNAQIRILGEDHPHTLRTMNNLALLHKEIGQLHDAEELFVEVVAVTRRVLGEDHPSTITALGNLAIVYDELRDFEKAESLLTKVIDSLRSRFGERHPNTLNAMNNLAASYRAQERFHEAEELWLETLEGQIESLGESHPSTLITKGGLAKLYIMLEQYEDAEPFAIQCHDGLIQAFGESHPHSKKALEIICKLYRAWGRTDRVDQLCNGDRIP